MPIGLPRHELGPLVSRQKAARILSAPARLLCVYAQSSPGGARKHGEAARISANVPAAERFAARVSVSIIAGRPTHAAADEMLDRACSFTVRGKRKDTEAS